MNDSPGRATFARAWSARPSPSHSASRVAAWVFRRAPRELARGFRSRPNALAAPHAVLGDPLPSARISRPSSGRMGASPRPVRVGRAPLRAVPSRAAFALVVVLTLLAASPADSQHSGDDFLRAAIVPSAIPAAGAGFSLTVAGINFDPGFELFPPAADAADAADADGRRPCYVLLSHAQPVADGVHAPAPLPLPPPPPQQQRRFRCGCGRRRRAGATAAAAAAHRRRYIGAAE